MSTNLSSILRVNPWRGLGGLPRAVWSLAATTLLNRMGTMVLPFLALYLTAHLGFTAEQAGRVLATYGATSLAAALLAGRLCDAWGPVRVMIASLAGSGIVLLLFPLAQRGVVVVGAAIVFALANESFRPPSLALVADVTPAAQRKAGFALNRLAINLGMSIGPALGGVLAGVSWNALFWTDAATSLAAACLLAVIPLGHGTRRWIAPAPDEVTVDPAPSGARVHDGPAWRDLRVVALLVANLPVAMVFFQMMSTMPLFVVRWLGLTPAIFGLAITINTVLIVLLEVPLNLAMARWPHRGTLALGSALVAAGFGAMALVHGPWTFAATVVVWTFGEMVLLPGLPAFVAELAPRGRTGEYMGLYQLGFGTAFVLGPWLGTMLLEHAGPRVLWSAALVAGLSSTAMFRMLPEPHKRDVRA